MPVVSRVYSFLSNFILSMILPNTEKGIGKYIFQHWWSTIWETLCRLLYTVSKWFLAFMDFLQYFIQKLVGLDYWLDSSNNGNRTLGEATQEDIIFKFLYADSVQKVFRAMIAIFIILLIVFTIFQIIKNEWDYMTGDGKDMNSKASIFRSSLKAIAIVIVFPVLLVMGIVSSNAILASIINATGVDTASTFGGKIFAISAKSANKYRHYVSTNAYLPTSDQVTFYTDANKKVIWFSGSVQEEEIDMPDGTKKRTGKVVESEGRIYYNIYSDYLEAIKKGTKHTIKSMFDPLVPRDTTKFSGFCFRVVDSNNNVKYYFISVNSKEKDDYEKYLTGVLGAQVLGVNHVESDWKDDGVELISALKDDASAGYIKKLNLAKHKSEVVRNTARNSWNYSLIYINPSKTLSQAISSSSGQSFESYHLGGTVVGTDTDASGAIINTYEYTGKGAILYSSDAISGYFDNGQFGVVQSKAEYTVMADVVDYMCDENLTFYIMDVTSPLINWNYHYVDSDDNTKKIAYTVDSNWISSDHADYITTNANSGANAVTISGSGDTAAVQLGDGNKYLTFLTSYSSSYALPAESDNDIIYTAKFDVGDESQGSRYIICLKDEGYYFPLVNGKEFEFTSPQGKIKTYNFKSNTYASDYRGVVWAKGTFDTSTVDSYYGNPTYLKNTTVSTNGDDTSVSSGDEPYFYEYVKDGDNVTINYYTYNTRILEGTIFGEKDRKAVYNNGKIYLENNSKLKIKATKINADDKDVTSVDVTDAAKLQSSKIVLTTSWDEGGNKLDEVYTLTYSGEVNVAGKDYYQFASEKSGFCYILYYCNEDGGKYYLPQNKGDNDIEPNTSVDISVDTETDIIPICHISNTTGKRANGNLIVKSTSLGKISLGKEAHNLGKNTFSIFTKTGTGDDAEDIFFGTFTKSILTNIDGTQGVMNSYTKKLELNTGEVYYGLNTQGSFTKTRETSVEVTSKFNANLKVNKSSALANMVEFFENVTTSDSVSCYRYNIENFSGNTLGQYMFETNVSLINSIFEIKVGTIQQISVAPDVSATFVYSGESEGITFDYFFDQNIELQTFYSAKGINYLLLLVASVLIIKVLFSALWGVIKRFYMITLYYLAMPVAASTLPLDGGSRFKTVRDNIIGEVLSVYGVLIGLNVFFVLLAPIDEIAHSIFTDEAIKTSGSYFLNNLNIGADVLNEFIYILFLLVAFTLIGELPGVVQGLVGTKGDVVQSGQATRDAAKKSMQSATDTISGKSLINTVKEAKATVPGLIPGSALIAGGAKLIGKGIDAGRKAFSDGVNEAGGGGGGSSDKPDGEKGEKKDTINREFNNDNNELKDIINKETTAENDMEKEPEDKEINAIIDTMKNARTDLGGGVKEVVEEISETVAEAVEHVGEAIGVTKKDSEENNKDKEKTQGTKTKETENKGTTVTETKEDKNNNVNNENNTTEEVKKPDEVKDLEKRLEEKKNEVKNAKTDEERAKAEKEAKQIEEELRNKQNIVGGGKEEPKGNIFTRIGSSKVGQVFKGLAGFGDENTAKGALLGLGGKALKYGAALGAAFIPGVGLLGSAAILGGSFLAKKGIKAAQKFKELDPKDKAKLISRWGGNVLKVAAIGTAGALTGGLALGAIAGGAAGGLLFVKGRRVKQPSSENANKFASEKGTELELVKKGQKNSNARKLDDTTGTGDDLVKIRENDVKNAEKEQIEVGAYQKNVNKELGEISLDSLQEEDMDAVQNKIFKAGGDSKQARADGQAASDVYYKYLKEHEAEGGVNNARVRRAALKEMLDKRKDLAQNRVNAADKKVSVSKKKLEKAKKLEKVKTWMKEHPVASAGIGLGLKALKYGAAIGAAFIPGAGLLASAAILSGSFLTKKGIKAAKNFKQLKPEDRAKLISRWGGNALKVAAVGTAAALTGGAGLALLASGATGGVLIAKGRRIRPASSENTTKYTEVNGTEFTSTQTGGDTLNVQNQNLVPTPQTPMANARETSKGKGSKFLQVIKGLGGYGDKDTTKGALLGLGGKALKYGAAIGAALIPGVGLLGSAAVLSAPYLTKKGINAAKNFKQLNSKQRADLISRWGGNALKVAAVGTAAALTGGLALGAIAGGAAGGLLFVKGRRVRPASSSTTEAVVGQSAANNASVPVTGVYSAGQTQQMIVDDGSNIANLMTLAMQTGVPLDDKNSLLAAAHFVNYAAINDKNFVLDQAEARRNTVTNSIGTKGGRAIASHALVKVATSKGYSLQDGLLGFTQTGTDGKQYKVAGLISDEDKLKLYKSMMTTDQLNTFNSQAKNSPIDAQLGFITNSLGLKLGIKQDTKGNLQFENTGKTPSNAASKEVVNAVLAGALSKVSTDVIEKSIKATGYSKNVDKAFAKNYALGINYVEEQTGNVTQAYHQSVFDLAAKDEDINAEAIYAYIKADKTRFEDFKNEYGVNENDDMGRILDYIKNDVKNPDSKIGGLNPTTYAKELSAVTAKHVADGTFKVQAFDLLSKKEQNDVAGRLNANLVAVSTGATFGYTPAEKKTDTEISNKLFGDNELVNAFLNSNIEDKDQTINKLVLSQFDEAALRAEFDKDESRKKFMAEKKDSGNAAENDVLAAYAKAKILGKEKEFGDEFLTNKNDKAVIEALMRGGKPAPEKKEFNFTNEQLIDNALKGADFDRLVAGTTGIDIGSDGKVDINSAGYMDTLYEMSKNENWSVKLQGVDKTSDEAAKLALAYSKAKILGKQNDKNVDEFIKGSKDADVAKRIAELSSEDKIGETDADLEALRDVSDKDIDYYEAHQKMINKVKTAFGYRKDGNDASNKAAEIAAEKYIASNGQNQDLVNSKDLKIDLVNNESDKRTFDSMKAKYFTPYHNFGQKTRAEYILEKYDPEKKESVKKLLKLRAQGVTKESLEQQSLLQTGAFISVDNLKQRMLTEGNKISETNATAQGNVDVGKVAEYLRNNVPEEQLNKLKSSGAENGFSALSSVDQNAILAAMAQTDKGATKVLAANNVSVGSVDAITAFLNSAAGEALKERLIASVSASLLSIFAAKLGLNSENTYNFVRNQTANVNVASVVEKSQGELISNARVKAYLEKNGGEDAQTIINNAAGMLDLLTAGEKTDIKTSAKGNKNQAIYAANQAALSNGGLERMRAVSDYMLNNNAILSKAKKLYGDNFDELSLFEKQKYMFANRDTLTNGMNNERNEIAKILEKNKIDFNGKTTDSGTIKKFTQEEFDNVIKAMKDNGGKILTNTKQKIVKENLDGLTEVPDEANMSKEELVGYRTNQTMLQQAYRNGKNPEVFASLFRNVTLINENESIRAILSGGNANATLAQIEQAKLDALKNNKEFYGTSVMKVMSSDKNKETLEKIINRLGGHEKFDKLSVAEKGEAINKVLSDKEFTQKENINANKLQESFDADLKQRAVTATNQAIKLGLTTAQISSYLAANEPTRDKLIKAGAHKPSLAMPNLMSMEAKVKYMLLNPAIRKVFLSAAISEMYKDKELKKLIRSELTNPKSPMFDSSLRSMTQREIANYINTHLSELKAKLAEQTIVNKQGDIVKEFNTTKVIEKLEKENPTVKGKLSNLSKELLKKLLGIEDEKDAEINEIADKVIKKMNGDSSFIETIDEKVRVSMKAQFESFVNTGEGAYLIEQVTKRYVDNPAVLRRHNLGIRREQKILKSQLARWQSKIK